MQIRRISPLSTQRWNTEVSSSFTIEPDSNIAIEKDELIDGFQAKIGELLKTGQELGVAKSQVQKLKESLVMQQKQFDREKRRFKKVVANLASKMRDDTEITESHTMHLKELTDENESLSATISELKGK